SDSGRVRGVQSLILNSTPVLISIKNCIGTSHVLWEPMTLSFLKYFFHIVYIYVCVCVCVCVGVCVCVCVCVCVVWVGFARLGHHSVHIFHKLSEAGNYFSQ